MSQAFPTLLLVISVAWSCSGNTTRVTSSGSLQDSKAADSTYMSQGKPESMESEAVEPPSQVTGSYLVCEEIPDSRLGKTEKKVGCSLQYAESGQNVDLEQTYRGHVWSFESVAPIEATIIELSGTERFQVQFLLSAARPELLIGEQFLDFKLRTEDDDGAAESFQTTLSTQFARWVPLNGVKVSEQAIAGGTAENGTVALQICRIFAGDLVVLGKARSNGTGSAARTVCYASYNGLSYESSSSGAEASPYRTEILVMNQLRFDDVFKWVSMKDGNRPDNAFTAGVDENDRPLFICQARESGDGVSLPEGRNSNRTEGELTPGVLAEGSSGCEYKFYDSKVKSEYRVLAWKSAKLKSLMDAANRAKAPK